LPPSYPTFVNQKEQNDENEEEEKADSDEAKTHRLAKFVDYFMVVYKELRSDRHGWKPRNDSYSLVISFYAAVGDAVQAMRLFEAAHRPEDPILPVARGNLCLSLLLANRLGDAERILSGAKVSSRVHLAVALAKNDRDAAGAALGKFEKPIRSTDLKVHFGDKDRMVLLSQLVKDVELSRVTEKGKAYSVAIADGAVPTDQFLVEEGD